MENGNFKSISYALVQARNESKLSVDSYPQTNVHNIAHAQVNINVACSYHCLTLFDEQLNVLILLDILNI